MPTADRSRNANLMFCQTFHANFEEVCYSRNIRVKRWHLDFWGKLEDEFLLWCKLWKRNNLLGFAKLLDLLKKMPNGVLQAGATFHHPQHNFGHHHHHYHYQHHQHHHQHHHHHHHHQHVFLKLVRHFTGLQSLLSTLQQAYQVKK